MEFQISSHMIKIHTYTKYVDALLNIAKSHVHVPGPSVIHVSGPSLIQKSQKCKVFNRPLNFKEHSPSPLCVVLYAIVTDESLLIAHTVKGWLSALFHGGISFLGCLRHYQT